VVEVSARRFLSVVSIAAFVGFLLVSSVIGQSTYHVEKQWVKLWINTGGTIDLLYNLTVACDLGLLSWVEIGQPNANFSVTSCTDLYNQSLDCSIKTTGDWYGVHINLGYLSIGPGQSATVILRTRVDKMIWEDEWNPGNVGMQFTPCWWPVLIEDLRLAVVVPAGVEKEEIKNSPDYDNIFQEDGTWVVYWNRTNCQPNYKLDVGVGFPQRYMTKWYSLSLWDKIVRFLTSPTFVVGGFSVLLGALAVVGFVIIRRNPYNFPKLSMEALGVRKGLMAVEAATLLDVEPRKILTMILFGLMKKGAVEVLETEPSLRLRVLHTSNLHFYENWFIDSIVRSSDTGQLSDSKLSLLILRLRQEVNDRMKYYCRADTVEYYQKTVEKAWTQVKTAGTPEVRANLFNENLDWLMMDPRFGTRTKRVFSRVGEIPSGSSWWLPYWVASYSPPSVRTAAEGKPAAPTTLPGSQFANAVVTSVESTVNRIVSNVEAFSKSLVPAAPPVAGRGEGKAPPVAREGCVCACAACACACACASCACACASGGAG